MFSGIVEATSRIVRVAGEGGTVRVRIEKPRGWRLAPGQSVAVDGICSTVAALPPGHFEVQYMPQTLALTTAADFQEGTIVNLERSLTLSSFVDGHLVAGHVDARVRIEEVRERDGSYDITFSFPKELRPYMVARGSVALSGVALTLASMSGLRARVALVPHTLSHTNLGALRAGMYANCEVDMLARYVVAAARRGGRVSPHAKKGRRAKR